MKRLSITLGISAIAVFVLYQIFFADRRSRLKVDTAKVHEAYNEFADPHSPSNELSVLAEEAVFHESIDRPNGVSEAKMIASLEALAEKLLIKNGTLFFEVEDLVASRKKVRDLVESLGGYISSDEEENYAGGPKVMQTIRIPSTSLDDFVSKVSGFAKSMRSKTISVKDVTEEYIDLEARLSTKKELEKNYRNILSRAVKVSEMLEVERQLEGVRSEIESLEGRRKYINRQVEFSIVSLTYFQVVPIMAEVPAVGSRLLASLGEGWSSFLDFVVNILSRWPFLIIGGAATWLVVRWALKRTAPSHAANT